MDPMPDGMPLDSPAVFRKRGRRIAGPHPREAFVAFRRTVDRVEEAKRRLAAAAPGGRSAGIPLAEALSGFEGELREAVSAMPEWRLADLEDVWAMCSAGLEESLRRTEVLRLGEAPEGYEHLYGSLADLMDPLDAFAVALRRFRSSGL
jgi:hypothetical protein